MKRAVLLVTVMLSLILASSYGKDMSSIKKGDNKNSVVAKWGKPDVWVKIKKGSNNIGVVTYSAGNPEKGDMPSDEIWIFQYKGADGKPFGVHFSYNKVDTVVKGPVLKE
ncbi:MAG: hypothetical protein WBN92_15045 [Terriglobia bacterium]